MPTANDKKRTAKTAPAKKPASRPSAGSAAPPAGVKKATGSIAKSAAAPPAKKPSNPFLQKHPPKKLTGR
ncbi:MAG: hypothetical protein L0Y66_10885 [Myxococcaceae bacterium]|nr:hypothetical protein [Myxococcaceae bacterium]MCI0669227.1 hypothetical protein [Myxococcaceae bacterium]